VVRISERAGEFKWAIEDPIDGGGPGGSLLPMPLDDPSVFSRAPWMALDDMAFGASAQVPTMLRPAERRLYLWLTSEWARGAGAVVDLGCFVGGSTAILAEGLRRAGLPGPVHAYDAFRISETAKARHLYARGIAPFEGQDMLPLAREFLAPWADLVRLHPGRIEAQAWEDGPIEILALDASKTAGTMDRMAESFLPALIPGRSVIVQQDFLHWKQPWVAVQMSRMLDWFRPLARAPRDSVAFLCTREIDAEALAAGQAAELSDAEMVEDLVRLREAMRGLGVGKGLKELVAAVELNPGIRAAAEMETRPG